MYMQRLVPDPLLFWLLHGTVHSYAEKKEAYAAINSAIDELIPTRVRGWTDLAINGTWWVDTAVGAALTVVLLNPHLFPVDVGWRLCCGMRAILGLAVLLVRRNIPESLRWLMMHGRVVEACT